MKQDHLVLVKHVPTIYYPPPKKSNFGHNGLTALLVILINIRTQTVKAIHKQKL